MGRTCSPTHTLFETTQLTLQLHALYAKYSVHIASSMKLSDLIFNCSPVSLDNGLDDPGFEYRQV